MNRPKRITTTDLAEVNVLSPGGSPLYRSYDRIARELGKRLDPETAALFGEPQVSAAEDEIDWYGPAGELRAWNDLDPAEREPLERRLADALDRVGAVSAELAREDSPESRHLSRLLDLALRIPGDGSIHVVEGNPVLTGWGAIPAGAAPDYHPLKTLRDRVRAREADARDENTASTTTTTSLPPVEGGSRDSHQRRWWIVQVQEFPQIMFAVSALLTAVLAIAIWRLLLESCGIALPSFIAGYGNAPFITYCDRGPENRRIAMTLIEDYENEIRERAQECSSPGTAGDGTPPAPNAPQQRGQTRFEDISPNVGTLCSIAVCNPTGGTVDEPEACSGFRQWADVLRKDVPSGYCRYVAYPAEMSVDPGTVFSGTAKLLVEGSEVESWPFEGKTISNDILKSLEKAKRPYLYWIADFPWPYPVDGEEQDMP